MLGSSYLETVVAGGYNFITFHCTVSISSAQHQGHRRYPLTLAPRVRCYPVSILGPQHEGHSISELPPVLLIFDVLVLHQEGSGLIAVSLRLLSLSH